MSVRKSERKISKLEYVQKAQVLCAHTFKMCANKKHFPEPVLADNIKKEALEILKSVRKLLSAATYEKNNNEVLQRYKCDALAHIDALYALLELAYNDSTYKIDAESMEYWVGLIVSLEDSLKNLD